MGPRMLPCITDISKSQGSEKDPLTAVYQVKNHSLVKKQQLQKQILSVKLLINFIFVLIIALFCFSSFWIRIGNPEPDLIKLFQICITEIQTAKGIM
jgi:hypothetical protein